MPQFLKTNPNFDLRQVWVCADTSVIYNSAKIWKIYLIPKKWAIKVRFTPLKLTYVSWYDLYQDKKRAPISECSRNKLLTKKQGTILGWIRTSMSLRTLDFKSNEYTISPQVKLAVRSFVARVGFEPTVGRNLTPYESAPIVHSGTSPYCWGKRSWTNTYSSMQTNHELLLASFFGNVFVYTAVLPLHYSPSIIYLLSTKLSNKNPSSFSYFLMLYLFLIDDSIGSHEFPDISMMFGVPFSASYLNLYSTLSSYLL